MNILVTRPSPDGEELVKKLNSIGIEAYHLPLIYFSPGKTLSLIKNKIHSLAKGDFLFIVSQHAVKYAHYQLLNTGDYWPNTIQYYTIGYKTSLKLYTLSGIKSKFPAYEENSENLVRFPELKYHILGRKALILKGNNGGRNFLKNTLKKRGALVLCCECYTRELFKYDGIEQCDRLLTLNIKIIVITTGEMLKQLYYLIPSYYRQTWLIRCCLIVVSLRQANLARKLGWTNIVITKSSNNSVILNTLIKNIQ